MYKELPDDWKNLFREKVYGLNVKGSQAMGLCPFHEDGRPSFSINIETSQWRCHAGCGEGNYWTFKDKVESGFFAESLPPTESPPINASNPGNPSAIYDYHDNFGHLVYQVLRYEPKAFRQRKINDLGEFEWSMQGIKRYPYNLTSLLQRPSEVLWWVEGEKDVENLRPFCLASTSSGGSNAWKKEIASFIPQRIIIVIPDKDMPGQAYAENVRDALLLEPTRTVIMSDVPDGFKDVSDYLAQSTFPNLKAHILQYGTAFWSSLDPFIFFSQRNISIPPWDKRTGNKTHFLKDILQNVLSLLDGWHDTYQNYIDFIDQQAQQTRDSDSLAKFLTQCKNLVEHKELLDGLH